MNRCARTLLALLTTVSAASAEEIFVTIQRVNGQTITVSELGVGRGRGRGRGTQSMTTLVIPEDAKITAASRERRTGKFRVGVELSGGLRNKAFQALDGGLQARIVTSGQSIKEINVMIMAYDINQSTLDPTTGQPIIAVRPQATSDEAVRFPSSL